MSLELLQPPPQPLLIETLESESDIDGRVAKVYDFSEKVIYEQIGTPGYDNHAYAEALINNGRASALECYLERFSGLDQGIALSLIDAGEGWSVARAMDKFEGSDSAIIADSLLEHKYASAVAENLEKFPSVDHVALAEFLLENRQCKILADNLDKFHGLDHQAIANQLLSSYKGELVAANLDKFEGLNHQEVLDKLFETRCFDCVANNFEKFMGVDPPTVANRLMEVGDYDRLANNLENFPGFPHQELVDKLVEELRYKRYSFTIIDNLEKFRGIDYQVLADKMIEAGYGWAVAREIKLFKSVDYQKVADGIVVSGQGQCVLQEIASFSDINRYLLFHLLLDFNQAWVVAAFFEEFKEYIDEEIAVSEIIKGGQGDAICRYIEKFQSVDAETLVHDLLDADQAYWVLKHINRFKSCPTIDLLKVYASHFDTYNPDFSGNPKVDENVRRRLESVADNVDRFFTLEELQPGITEYLAEECKVTELGRYPTGLLIDQFRYKDDLDTPYGVLVLPASDYNGGFAKMAGVLVHTYGNLLTFGYHLRICECDGKISAARQLLRLDKKYGQNQKISFALIGGHGTPESITFGAKEVGQLEADDLKGKGVQRVFGPEFFVENPTFVLISCSTGVENGIGQKISDISNGETIGPNAQTNVRRIQVRQDEDGKLQFKVLYKGGEHENATYSKGLNVSAATNNS